VVGRSYSLVCSFQLCYPPTLGQGSRQRRGTWATGPLIDSIVGDHHEDVIDDDAKQFAPHALGME
jgi:hypothetical protein